MRRFKFRAWNSAENSMYYHVGLLPHEKGGYIAVDEKGLMILDMYGSAPAVMQFTGLLDKNGKEIYEGDILKLEDATAKVVFWERPPEFGLDYRHNEDKWCEDWNLSDDSERMEIISNIYEHPELVEVRHE
jgi:uncharacterized phage protein (TIGR01671 family)